MRRGVEWLVRNQEAGRQLVRPLGRRLHLRHLLRAARTGGRRAKSDREAHILRAGEWLRSIQNADGGWGESCASYDNGCFTAGPSTPSQTAWALMGLIAGGDAGSLSVQHGIEYLLETQQADGSWDGRVGHRNGVPEGFLSELPLVQGLFPAACAGIAS